MNSVVLALALGFPTPPELGRPPAMTEWGEKQNWWYPDKYTLARHDGRKPHSDDPDWPAVKWRSSGRQLKIASVWFDRTNVEGGWLPVCDDPCCPMCVESVYLPRK